MRGARAKRLVLWVFVCAVAAYLVLPALVVIPMSLNSSPFLQFPPPGFTTEWYTEFFADPLWIRALWLTVRVAVISAVIAVVVGTAVAYALTRRQVPLHRWFDTLFGLPIVVPVVVYGAGAYVLIVALPAGMTVVLLPLAHATLAIPFVVTNVRAALETTDARLELAAQTLGASPLTAFRTVVLPTIAPAVGAGALLAVVLSLDETVVSLFLTDGGTQTMPVRMFASISYELNPLVPVASTVMLGLTASAGIAYLAIRLAARAARRRPRVAASS
ncbi:MAG: ydcV 2 [Modestobacter sp.]|nr:ydcV 2 [Modestobacter sp.]